MKILILLITFSVYSAFAMEGGGLIEPLEWQKVKLEYEIISRISSGINKILDVKLYMVEVDIIANSPERPDFYRQKSQAMSSVLSFSDIKKRNVPKDSLLFAKFGMEAPTIQKQSRTEIVQGVRIAQIWDYNQSMNIFNNIESVKVVISISETVAKGLRTMVEVFAKKIKLPIVDTVPQFTFEYVNYIAPLKNVKNDNLQKSADEKNEGFFRKLINIDTLSKFSIMMGIIIGAILLAMALIFKGRKNSEQQTVSPAIEDGVPLREAAPVEDSNVSSTSIGNRHLESPPDILESMQHSFVRFKSYLNNDSLSAAILVKEWLAGRRDEHAILKIIADKLPPESLEKIFSHLNEEERKAWRESIDIELSLSEKINASSTLKNRITSEIISPSIKVDEEIASLILKMPTESFIKLIDEHFEDGCLLLNIVNMEFASKVMTRLEPEIVQKIAEQTIGMDIKKELSNSSKMGSLKRILQNYKIDKEEFPGIGKIRVMLGAVSYAIEIELWSMLRNKFNKVELIEEAKKVFPSELVFIFSEQLIKSVMKNISHEKRVELFMSLKDVDRVKLLNGFAPEGSQVRDMINLEIERKSNDLMFRKRIKEKSDDIWISFIREVRINLKTLQSAEEEMTSLIEIWANGESFEAEAIKEVA